MVAPKCRLDIWKPTIQTVTSVGATSTVQRPDAWVKCDTVTDVTSGSPNPNLRRGNACTSVEIKDELFSPRIAYISIANRPLSFKAFDDETFETQYQDSDGSSIASGTSRLRRNWGPFTNFFREFQHVRIVDLETHMVLFTGRIYKIDKKHDGQRGAVVELVCKDALEDLKNLSMKTLPKEMVYGANTQRSKIVQSLLNLAMDYEGSLPAGGANQKQTSPVITALSASTMSINSNDAAASTAANSYSRFEFSATAPTVEVKLKTRKTGSKDILRELTRWAILEPHEDETAENQFGYDFFVDPNIGSTNLLATTPPPPAMFNYFKRGNRLSAAGSAGQDADTYGLTCILPQLTPASRKGIQQRNVGTTAATGSSSAETFLVETGHSLYPGQVITIGSEQMFVKFTSTDENLLPDETANVVRGWRGSTAASFSSDATIVENQAAVAVIQKDTANFNETKDELFTECDLTYDTAYFVGTEKKGNKENIKKFEIMYVTEIVYGDTPEDDSPFAWSGLNFDDFGSASDADTPGTDSAEFVSAYREDGSTLLTDGADVARIQYQSTGTITGGTSFAYIMLSDISEDFPTENYTGQSYITLKGNTSNAKCNLNVESIDILTGRPSTAFSGGNGDFKRGFAITKENSDNIDDIRQEVAARLGQSTIAMKRGDFLTARAPYYFADFKVRGVSNDGSTGQILTVKSKNGTAAINVTNYGFREGMVVHKIDSTTGVTAIASGNAVYGYCYSMTADDTFRVNLTETQDFVAEDFIRLFIPVRAGDVLFVDHILGGVYGEHLVTCRFIAFIQNAPSTTEEPLWVSCIFLPLASR